MERRDFFEDYQMGTKRLFYGDQYGRAGQELVSRMWAMCGMDNPNPLPQAAATSPGGLVIPGVDGGNAMQGFSPPKSVGLVLQFDVDSIHGSSLYPGVFVTIPGVSPSALKYTPFTETSDFLQGATWQGAIVEQKGGCGYGFAAQDWVFQVDIASNTVLNALSIRTNTASVINATLDDVNNFLYVIMARDGSGDVPPDMGREIFKIATRDDSGNPALVIKAHIIVTPDMLRQIHIDIKNQKIFCTAADKIFVYDTDLNLLNTISDPGDTFPSPQLCDDNNGNILSIKIKSAGSFMLSKYSSSGSLLESVSLGSTDTPYIAVHDKGKFEYIVYRNIADNDGPQKIDKVDTDAMSIVKTGEIIFHPSNSERFPVVLDIDPITGNLWLVCRYNPNLIRINPSDLTYKIVASDGTWQPCGTPTVCPSNKAIYYKGVQ